MSTEQAAHVSDLAREWRTTAETFLTYGAREQAALLHRCADELDTLLAAEAEQSLTLKQASQLGGYSEDHLGRRVREGKIPNAGRAGAPRIARRDVPIKPGWVAAPSRLDDIDVTQIVRSAINAGAG